jgi:hypothetical protein
MEFLFDSKSQNIANLVNNQLHTPNGQHIGNYLKNDILVDKSGAYIGEIVQNNRLMYNENHGDMGIIKGYQDINTPWL